MSQISNFKDLQVWQKAHLLVLDIYRITKKFPGEEKFSLSSQIRRAIISVASNIVEGFHRYTVKDSLHFYNISESSLEEVKYQLLVAKDLGYLPLEEYLKILILADEVGKMLKAWSKSQIANKNKLNLS